jgi:hypothetical protein
LYCAFALSDVTSIACCQSVTLSRHVVVCLRAMVAHAARARTAVAGNIMRSRRPSFREINRAPRHDDETSDERNVRVSISHRLKADLNYADHRQECAEIPKPADE